MSPACYKGCAEWKASIGGSLFEATEPEGCACDKVTVMGVTENVSSGNRMIQSNRGIFGSIFNYIFRDKPQDMSPACYKGCAEWKASGSGSLFEATEPEGCACDKVTVMGVTENLSAGNRMMESSRGIWGFISSIFGDKPQDMSPACYKGCAEWKASGGGSLFEATEPEGCACEKVTVASVTENLSTGNRMMESNRGLFSFISSIFMDKPQDMSPACYKGCAEWKASIGGSLFDATEPKDCDCDKVNVEKVVAQ